MTQEDVNANLQHSDCAKEASQIVPDAHAGTTRHQREIVFTQDAMCGIPG
jgi:hypothetical protein